MSFLRKREEIHRVSLSSVDVERLNIDAILVYIPEKEPTLTYTVRVIQPLKDQCWVKLLRLCKDNFERPIDLYTPRLVRSSELYRY